VRLEQSADKARLVFDTTSELVPKAYVVDNPGRVIVDLPEVAFLIDPNVGRLPASHKPRAGANRLIKSYRFGLFAPGRSRIVIDLERPAKILRAASETSRDGPRLAIELGRSDPASFAAAAAEHARAAPPPPETLAQPPAPPAGKPVVVIDPGHGGVDVGAAGAHGEQEKAIVFEFAKALQAKIEAGGRLHAILTRNEDVFVALDDRVRFAKQNNAALFLSVHADTLGEASVQGATVYTASAKASDAEAQRIAEKENLADQAAGLERKEDAEEVGDILFDLTRRETRAYSRQFAQALVSRWKDAGSLNKNPSRSAGFVVLKAHNVPSVLLELGYLSSEKDLANLTSAQWREQMAAATANAIESFFAGRGIEPQDAAPTVAATARPQ
jgi:N-acetylmuramoyl-L-alanine amidase